MRREASRGNLAGQGVRVSQEAGVELPHLLACLLLGVETTPLSRTAGGTRTHDLGQGPEWLVSGTAEVPSFVKSVVETS